MSEMLPWVKIGDADFFKVGLLTVQKIYTGFLLKTKQSVLLPEIEAMVVRSFHPLGLSPSSLRVSKGWVRWEPSFASLELVGEISTIEAPSRIVSKIDLRLENDRESVRFQARVSQFAVAYPGILEAVTTFASPKVGLNVPRDAERSGWEATLIWDFTTRRLEDGLTTLYFERPREMGECMVGGAAIGIDAREIVLRFRPALGIAQLLLMVAVDAGPGNPALAMELEVPMNGPLRTWRLTLKSPFVLGDGLRALSGLIDRLSGGSAGDAVGQVVDCADERMEESCAIDMVYIDHLEILLSEGAVQLISFGIHVEAEGGWDLGASIRLDRFGFTGQWRRGGTFRLGLNGVASFGQGGMAAVAVSIPFQKGAPWILSVEGHIVFPSGASLEDCGKMPQLADTGFSKAVPKDFLKEGGSLTLDGFEVVFDPFAPAVHSISVTAELDYWWELGYGIAIHRIVLDADWRGESGVKTLTGTMAVFFAFGGGHQLHLQGELKPEGYKFSGDWEGTPVPIGELCGLPGFLGRMKFRKAGMSFERTQDGTIFHADLTALIGEDTVATLDFDLVKPIAPDESISYSGTLLIADVEKESSLGELAGDTPALPAMGAVKLRKVAFERGTDRTLASVELELWGKSGRIVFLQGENGAAAAQGSAPTEAERERRIVALRLGSNASGIPLLSTGQIPLLGKLGPDEPLLVLEEFVAFLAAEGSTGDDLNEVSGKLGAKLPTVSAKAILPPASISVLFKGMAKPITFGEVREPSTPAPTAPAPAPAREKESAPSLVKTAPPPAGGSKSHAVTIGPLAIDRLTVGPAETPEGEPKRIIIALDAAVSIRAVTLDLYGVGITTPLDAFQPRPVLSGVGLRFESEKLSLGASFKLFTTQGLGSAFPGLVGREETIVRAFEAAAFLRTPRFSISGSGAFVTVAKPGQPADPSHRLLITLLAAGPIGGPPALFVTGLRGAFGLNTRLRQPAIEELEDFPLLKDDLEAASLREWVTASDGDSWLALGVDFTSFQLITCRALLFAQLGRNLEFALFGRATLQLPRAASGTEKDRKKIFAHVELNLMATVKPAEGSLSVAALVDSSSFLLHQDCRITGGAAFCLWAGGEHAGDFVLTVGGYHPGLAAPAHYPRVPRVGFHWKLDDRVQIKGELYYALTPAVMMFGGRLEIQYRDDALHAWLIAGFNAFVEWAPFHFDFEASVEVGVSYTLRVLGFARTFTAEISAVLELNGPPLAGRALVNAGPVSFAIAFGAEESLAARTATWQDVRALLPPHAVTIAVVKGAEPGGAKADKIPRVRIHQLVLTVESKVPILEATYAGGASLGFETIPFTVHPLAGKDAARLSRLNVSVAEHTSAGPRDLSQDRWRLQPRRQRLPRSLWRKAGERNAAEDNRPVEEFCVGLEMVSTGAADRRFVEPAPESGPPPAPTVIEFMPEPAGAEAVFAGLPTRADFATGPRIDAALKAAMGLDGTWGPPVRLAEALETTAFR